MRGPAVVIGRTSKQVFIKHGGFILRLNPVNLEMTELSSCLEDEVIDDSSDKSLDLDGVNPGPNVSSNHVADPAHSSSSTVGSVTDTDNTSSSEMIEKNDDVSGVEDGVKPVVDGYIRYHTS